MGGTTLKPTASTSPANAASSVANTTQPGVATDTPSLYVVSPAGQRALILFAHGARDARWAAPFERLQQLVQSQQPDVTVGLAFLEFMRPRLPELVRQLAEQGCTNVTLVPVFLGQGGHVLRDLPILLDELRLAHSEVSINTVDAVGEDAGVLEAIASYCIGSLNRG